ncbi:MAG: PAS domain-containing protein [Burkholderiales bacterium]|nr:MAG: PAS domain-containing protein [Burkholderiales bacterium]
MKQAAPPLEAAQVERAFPFYLWLDDSLRVKAFGPSLATALPGLRCGDPLDQHFSVRRPTPAADFADWQAHGRSACTLFAIEQAGLRLRGAVEWPEAGGLLLLIAPVLTSLDELRTLNLALTDFAPQDNIGELLLLGRSTQMALQDTRRMADQLRVRSQQLHSVIELCADGVAFCDADGYIQHANAALHELLGLPASPSLVGMPIDALEHQLRRIADTQTTTPRPFFDRHAEDHVAPVQLVLYRPAYTVLLASARRSADGGRAFYLHDATQATEVDRMKSEFLTTAAHELRTPMVSVFGFTELLLRRSLPDERRRDVLETIHRQSSLLVGMLNELLDVTRLEARRGLDFDCRPCTLQDLLVPAVEPHLVQDTHSFELRIAHPDTPLQLDACKTQRALAHVLSNAVQFSSPGSPIEISSLHGELRGRPALGVRVADRGIGMTPEQQARMFERFYRADPSGHRPGAGLGMSLVKEIVELQGGRVEVESRLGEGTAVTLWLPRREAEVATC